MNKKNVVLFEATNSFYTVGCPVQLIKYQILRKPNSTETFARLVFGRKSKRRVRSVVFDFRTFDGTGAALDTCTDQCISADRYIPTFDGKTLFPISTESQIIRLKIKRVLFEPKRNLRKTHAVAAEKFIPTGETVDVETPTPAPSSDVWISKGLPIQKVDHIKTVTNGKFSVEAAECLADVGGRAKFDYHDYGSSWLCSCGMLNDERERCAACHAKKSDVENAFKAETLQERHRKDTYDHAVKTAAETHSIKTVRKSIDDLKSLGDYKDSPKQISVCQAHIREIKKAWTIFSSIMAVIIISIIAMLIWFAAEDKKVEGLYLTKDYNGYSFSVSTYGTQGKDEVVVPATYKGSAITTVKERAFANIEMQSVTLPSTITRIEKDAFGKSKIEEVHFQGTIAEWSAICFESPSANPVYCGATVYVEGDGVINGELRLPENVTEIGDYAFYGWSTIHSVRNLDKVTKIGSYAFSKTSLESADISSVTHIGKGAFYETYLSEITIPDCATWIGAECLPAYLKKLSLPSLRKGDYDTEGARLAYFFMGNSDYSKNYALEEVAVRGGTLPEVAFKNFEALTKVTLPSGTTTIPKNAFYGCSSLTNFTIPASVTEIGDYAFDACSALSDLVIPSSVTSIGYGAALNCSALSVYYDGNATQWNRISLGKSNAVLTQNLFLYSETEPASSDDPLWHYDESGAPVKYDMKKVSIDRGMNASDSETVTMKVEGYSVNYLEIHPRTSGTLSVRSLNTSGGVYGYLYDANKKSKLAYSQPSSYSGKAFSFTYSVKAGTVYYIGVENDNTYSSTAKINVQIELSGVQISVDQDTDATVRYYKKGETIALDAAPTRSGYSFLGWYANGSLMDETSFTVNKDCEVTARWHKLTSVTLTYFNYDNSETSSSVSNLSSYTYQLLRVSAYSAISLSLTSSSYATVKIYDASKTTVKKDLTLSYSGYPNYNYTGTMTVSLSAGDYYLYADRTISANITSGWAVFVTSNNQNTTTKSATEGEIVTLPTPTRSGYIFTGWTVNNKAITGTTYTVPATDVTFVATWTNKAELTFIYDNGTDPTTTLVTIGSTYNLPTDIVKTGKTFSAWCIDLGNEGLGSTVSNSYTMPNYAVTLRATWSDKANLTLIYDNGETETETVSLTIGESYALPTPEKAGGYEFLGWYVDLGSGELGDKVEGTSYEMPDRHVTLRARWPKDVTVTFDEGPSFITTDSVTFSSGAYKRFRATKNGSVSIRVETSSSSTVKIYDADKTTLLSSWSGIYIATVSCSLKANQDYYLYCTKSGSASISSDYVAFVTGEQNKVSTRPAIEGHLLDYPTPEKAGHFFLGWYLGDDKIDPATYTAPDHDVTLTAKWAKNTTVTFELGGYVEEYASGSTSASYDREAREKKALMVEDTGEVTFSASGYSYAVICLYDETLQQLARFDSDSSGRASGKYTLEAGKLYYVDVAGATYVSVSGDCHPYFPIKHVEQRATYVGAEIPFPEPDERDGFEFYGWFQGEQALAGNYFIVPNSDNITVTAAYNPTE